MNGRSGTNDAVVGTADADRKSREFEDHVNLTPYDFGVSGRTKTNQGVGGFGFTARSANEIIGFSAVNDGVGARSECGQKSGVFGGNTHYQSNCLGVSGRSQAFRSRRIWFSDV